MLIREREALVVGRKEKMQVARSLVGLVSVGLVLIGLAASSDVLITSPHSVIQWKAGKTAKITWNTLVDEVKGGTPGQTVNIDLMDGDDKNAKVIARVAKNIPIEKRAVSWTVPDNFPSTKTIFVKVSSPDGKISRYSHRFAIQGNPAYRWGDNWELPQSTPETFSPQTYSSSPESTTAPYQTTTTKASSSVTAPTSYSTTSSATKSEDSTSTEATTSTDDYESTSTTLRGLANGDHLNGGSPSKVTIFMGSFALIAFYIL